MNESIMIEDITLDDYNIEQYIKDNQDTVLEIKQAKQKELVDKELAEKNTTLIESKLFKKTYQAKYLIKNALYYENLANNVLFTYYARHMWQCGFDKKSKKLYIINLICPNTIPSFSLIGIKTLEEFNGLVLGAGKKILVEENLNGSFSTEEFDKRLLQAKEVAEKYKD